MKTQPELSNIEDVEKQIKEIQVEYNHRITDFSIGELLKKFKLKKEKIEPEDLEIAVLIVPQYQREFIWEEKMQSKFIESIFIGVPIQPLFAFELDEDGNMELLDGVQRLTSLRDFVNNKLVLGELEELTSLNGYKFEHLETSRKRKFKNTSLKLYIINENTDEGVRADIFRRVNEGGRKLVPAEIRKGKFLENSFYSFILECIELPEFTDLFSSAKNDHKLRGEKEELISRFFAYSNNYKKFDHSVKLFLDDYIVEEGKSFDERKKDIMKTELIKTLNFIKENLPDGFRKNKTSKSIPRVRFESIAVGTNLALRSNPNLSNIDSKWLLSEEFKKWTTSDASNSKTKVVGRVEFVRDCLLGNTDINTLTYVD